MSYAGSIMSSMAIAAGTGQEMYGYWYEGQQQRYYYLNQAQITEQSKKVAEAGIANQERIAADQQKAAEYQKSLDDLKIDAYKAQSDKAGSALYARLAKSGVDVSHGSPLEYLSAVADARAKETAVMGLQRDKTYWQEQNKAAITLDAANLQRVQLPMYDYQYQLYGLAADEAPRIAAKKVTSAAIAAVGKAAQAWGGSMGSGAGGGAGAAGSSATSGGGGGGGGGG